MKIREIHWNPQTSMKIYKKKWNAMKVLRGHGRHFRPSSFYAQARWFAHVGLSWLPFGGPCGGFLGVCGLALVSFGFPLGALGRLRAPFGRCWALLGRAFDRFWVASVSLCSFRDGFWVAGVCLGNLCFQQPADHTPGDLPWVGGLIVFKTYYIELLAFDVFF